MGQQAPHEVAAMAAEVLRQQSDAQAVAVWLDDSPTPTLVLNEGIETNVELEFLWPKLRARLAKGPRQRLREVDEEGSQLRSALLVGAEDGKALIALNRHARSPLEESGFRDEDEEAALALLAALGVKGWAPVSSQATLDAAELTDYARTRQLLLDALRRELERAQRYHFGFSVTLFQIELDATQWQRHGELFRQRLASGTRNTDCVLWLEAGRFAILAPEEARGQRRLARRIEATLQELLSELDLTQLRISTGSAAYPQQGDGAENLLAYAESILAPGSIDNPPRPA
jgi:GGDEF domain-containing protein